MQTQSAIAEGELRKFRSRVIELEEKSKEDTRTIQSLQHQLDEASVFIKAKPIFQSKLSQLSARANRDEAHSGGQPAAGCGERESRC